MSDEISAKGDRACKYGGLRRVLTIIGIYARAQQGNPQTLRNPPYFVGDVPGVALGSDREGDHNHDVG